MATIATTGPEVADPRHPNVPDSWSWWLADRLATEPDPQRALARAAAALSRQLGVDQACFAAVTPQGDTIDVALDWPAAATGERRRRAAWLAGCRTDEPLIVADVAASPQAADLHATLPGAGALVAVPLLLHGTIAAVVVVAHDLPHAWHDDEVELVVRVATLSLGALEHCRAAARLAQAEAACGAVVSAMPGGWRVELGGVATPQPASPVVESTVSQRLADGTDRLLLRRGVRVGTDGAWCGVEIDQTEQHRRERDDAFRARLADALQVDSDADAIAAIAAGQLGQHLQAHRARYCDAPVWPARPVTIADLVEEPELVSGDEREPLLAAGARALLRVVVVSEGEVVAGIEVTHDTRRVWRADEIALAEDVACRAWALVARARAAEALAERERATRFLLAWSDGLRDMTSPRVMLATTLDRLGRHLRVTRLFYAEADAAGATLTVRQQWGLGDALAAAPVPVADVLGDAAPRGVLAITDRAQHPAFAAYPERAEGAAALLAAPLHRGGRLAAVLCAHGSWPRAWTIAETQLLADVADRLCAALDRAQVAARLAESEALLAAFMEHAPVGMHLKDASGRYLRVNPELAVAIGQPVEAITDRRPADLFPPAIAQRLDAMERAAAAGDLASEEFVTPAPDRYASFLSIAFPIGGNHQARTGGFTIDLTERKAAEAALARSRDALYQSEKLSALGSLLAGVSHELNNPLSIVVAQAVMLERQAEGSALADRAFKIRKAADRCARIVQTFLAMARQKKPERRPVDINQVVAAALELADYNLRTTGIGVTRALAPDLPRIGADADQLHQIVTNLVVNAQQAMAGVAGPRWLTLTTSFGPEPDTVILDVGDTGPGVPPDLRRRLFEPFYTTKPQSEGTGVGLSFSQGLAEAHGGRLALLPSERGACFRLTLPIDPALTLPRVEPAPRTIASDGRRALIVDDEEEIASSLADFLAAEGYQCDVAIGGVAAQARLAEGHPYDLVVSDLRMPDVDGPALHAWIARERPDLTARVAFTTGDTLGAAAARFLADARRPVLEKPFMPDTVRHFLVEIETA